MDSFHFSMLIFLFTFSSFNHVFSYTPQSSYKDHCASIVPESTPSVFSPHSFPLGDHNTGYFTGGDRTIDIVATRRRYSFTLQIMSTYATQVPGLFSIVGTARFVRTSIFRYRMRNISYDGSRSSNWRQRGNRRDYLTFKLVGFWSETSGKVCMVGTSTRTGNSHILDAVFKLNNVYDASNISSLVSGSLESLSSEKDENYFEPFYVLMFPIANHYNYTLDSIEAENELSKGSDTEKGLSLDFNSSSFCSSYPLSRVIKRLWLEYSSDCNSSKNCTPTRESSGQLPSLLSLRGIECSHKNKPRFRFLMEFLNTTYYQINQGFNPKNMLLGEGWWDEKNNRLCVVACHVIAKESSLDGAHVDDCSVRLTLRIPSILSIKNSSSIEGQIWSNKIANDAGYFRRITFRTDEDLGVEGQGLKYNYCQLDRVKQSCPTHKPVKSKGTRRYPDAYSYNMRFDMSVRESYRRVGWGYSAPFTVGDRFHDSYLRRNFDSFPISSKEVPNVVLNNASLFNISYKISISRISNSTLSDRNSLFNLSSEVVKISAEGIYDAGAGTLCMVGCRDLPSNDGTPKSHSLDCEILVKFQLPSLDTYNGSYIMGSIESTRKKSDPLYFKSLDLSSAAFYTEAAREAVWRMDMEIIMALISKTLACVFVGLQLYHVKRHPDVLPFTSLIMMSILTLGYLIPLVLNFEALLTQNPNNKNFVLGNVGWLEVNEISVRLITMVAFLLQFRLLQMAWSSRKSDEGNKGLWADERKAAFVTLPLYAAGLLIALLLKLKKNGSEAPILSAVYQQHPSSSWDNFKSYGGLVLDGFLLPQIILNLFSNMEGNVLLLSFYFGTTFVRLLPHAYDLYRRTHNYAGVDNGLYVYAVPNADFYSTAWDIVIPLGGILFAIVIYLQQSFGARYVLPRRFKGSNIYEKVPAVTDSKAEVETTNM
ncbi:hypothetical protein RIF29_39122 [Crotalaria pallida]|uniref:RING-type E3 ubiquitin transferase n=1 Tax=Crotalaria pallida TaxID=3830 RepID=A0AAN9E331_CROPI